MPPTTLRNLSEKFGDDDVMMTAKETAEMCRRAPVTLERWRREGIGPEWEVVNGRPLYRRKKVRQFLGLEEVPGKAA